MGWTEGFEVFLTNSNSEIFLIFHKFINVVEVDIISDILTVVIVEVTMNFISLVLTHHMFLNVTE